MQCPYCHAAVKEVIRSPAEWIARVVVMECKTTCYFPVGRNHEWHQSSQCREGKD